MYVDRTVTAEDRAEVWDQIAAIRERDGDPVRAQWARHNAETLRDLARHRLVTR